MRDARGRNVTCKLFRAYEYHTARDEPAIVFGVAGVVTPDCPRFGFSGGI